MKKKNEAIEIIKILKEYYPEAKCSLDFTNPFEMAISVMLSAQCTDERVNKTTPYLFSKANTPEEMCKLTLEEIEDIIKPCGFYKNKAKNILACSKMLLEKYDGVVPDNMDDLQKLPGIGRKSANVIMLEAFNNPQGIAVDTHARRISNKIGFSKKEDPGKIEQDLLQVLPKEWYYDANHLFVWHGRYTCIARKPKCNECPIKQYCDTFMKEGKDNNE